jgi:hypothetical protein
MIFFYNLYQISKKWNLVIQRHRFFVLFSFYFVLTMFFLVASGVYQSYEKEGVKLLILFVTCNVYIMFLQFMWNFNRSNSYYKDVEDDIKISSKEIADERRLGLNYFNPKYEIDVSRSQPSSQNQTINTSYENLAFGNQEKSAFLVNHIIINDTKNELQANEKEKVLQNYSDEYLNQGTREGSDRTLDLPLQYKEDEPEEFNLPEGGEIDFQAEPEAGDNNGYDQFDEENEGGEVDGWNRDELDLFDKYKDYDTKNNNK